MNIRYPREVSEVAETLHQAGYQCYLIGGAVRDQLLGKPAKDFDLTSNARPEEVMKLFRRVIPTGIQHGTVTVMKGTLPIEITTFRLDGDYSDGRRPDRIEYTPSVEEDLKRRDFTINSIAFNPVNNELLDPNNGLDDLNLGIIRAIGDPEERFNEDGLRSIRACRFASQLKFTIEEYTLKGIRNSLHRIPDLSRERIFEELTKILKTEKPSVSFKLFRDTGILEMILPDLHAAVGIEQKGFHKYDIFEHSIYSCDGVPASEVEIRYAALFHDLGKVATKVIKNDQVTFYNHEKESAVIAERVMKQYRFPNRYIKKILHLITFHMFHYEPNWTDSAVRRFISRIGRENLDDLFLLRQGDIWGTARETRDSKNLKELKIRISELLKLDHAFTIKDLRINGTILQQEGAIAAGKDIGIILKYLLDRVLDEPELNQKEDLLSLACKFYSEKIQKKQKG